MRIFGILVIAISAVPALAAAKSTQEFAANNVATVLPDGPRVGSSGEIFFNVQGSSNESFASFGVADFLPVADDTCEAITGLSVSLAQSIAGFTTNGLYGVYLTDAVGVEIEEGSPIAYQSGTDGIAAVDPAFTNLSFLGSFSFVLTADGTVDTVDLFSDLNAAAVADVLAAVGSGSTIRLLFVPEEPGVSATYAGIGNFDGPAPTLRAECDGGGSSGGSFVRINEFHYDNVSTDVGEFVELVGDSGTSLDGWQLVLYNGSASDLGPYDTVVFGPGSVFSTDGFVVVDFPSNGIQNGAPDGLALVDPAGTVVEFLSYEGTFQAASGPAAGLSSVDVGVAETSGTPEGSSLQLIDGVWVGPIPETPGATNTNPTVEVTPFANINEFHYDNESSDLGEFVEIAGNAGDALRGWELVLYNGTSSDRGPYDTVSFEAADVLSADGLFVFSFPSNGIQNGAPDGLALVNPAGDVVEFLSYEGTFEAASGPAAGLTSTDIGVAETGETPVGFSLQLVGGAWLGPIPETPGAINEGSTAFEPRTIMAIQGAGQTSPEAGNNVETSGVVTAVGEFDAVGQSDELGFYLQDPSGDGDIATSDAVFVVSDVNLSVGDAVTVRGFVEESGFPGELTYTRLQASSVTIGSSANALPSPVLLGAGGRVPPSENIDDDALAVFEPGTDGLDFFESLEAMRVTVQAPLAVSPTSRFGEVFVVVDGGASASGISTRKTLNISADDFNPEKIQIDSGRESFDPQDIPIPILDAGAMLADITGVVGYDFGNFQVQPDVEGGPVTVITPATISPETTTLSGSESAIQIVTYNVLNLDPNDSDGDTDLADGRFAAIAEQIVNNLNTPDVLGLQEIQDNTGSVDDGVTAADLTLQTLVDAIAEAGGPGYLFIDNTFIGDNTSGGQPGANIRTAFLYNPDRVDLLPGSVRTVDDVGAFAGARLPLIAAFEFAGEVITVVNNHFSSKGGSAPIFGTEQPFEARQEEVAVNGSLDERLAQSGEVRTFVDGVLSADPEAKIVVLGDLNEFEFISPVSVNLGEALNNLTFQLPEDERYTFVFQGNSQSLDHIFLSDSLVSLADFDAVHLNVEFAETAERASDHDPLVVTIDFQATPTCEGQEATVFVAEDGLIVGGPLDGRLYNGVLVGTFGADVIVGTDGKDFIAGGFGADLICGEDGRDLILGGPGRDRILGGEAADRLDGGLGRDELDGGPGTDRCRGGLGRDEKTSCEG